MIRNTEILKMEREIESIDLHNLTLDPQNEAESKEIEKNNCRLNEIIDFLHEALLSMDDADRKERIQSSGLRIV